MTELERQRVNVIAQMAATLAAGDAHQSYLEGVGVDAEWHASKAIDLYDAVERLEAERRDREMLENIQPIEGL